MQSYTLIYYRLRKWEPLIVFGSHQWGGGGGGGGGGAPEFLHLWHPIAGTKTSRRWCAPVLKNKTLASGSKNKTVNKVIKMQKIYIIVQNYLAGCVE